MNRSLASICACLLGLVLQQAHAGCLGIMSVGATNVGFGSYNPLNASQTTGTGQVTVTCNLVIGIGLLPSFTLALSGGTSGNASARQMASGANRLNYNLYNNLGAIWGNGLNSTALGSFNGLLSIGTLNFAVNGRIPAGQDKPAGNYADTISVIVDF